MVADEKHTKRLKEKAFIATTVANECILGAEFCSGANKDDLTEAYGVFASQAKNMDNDYTPKSVNIDGWSATIAAFSALFVGITIIYCFLHGFIKIRDCCRKSKEFGNISSRVWHVYKSKTKKSFGQRM